MRARSAGGAALLAWLCAMAAGAAAQPLSPPRIIRVTYRCSHGGTIDATYELRNHDVTFAYAGKHVVLLQARSADGARYVGSGLEWWEKGPNARLSSVPAGSTYGRTLLAGCIAS